MIGALRRRVMGGGGAKEYLTFVDAEVERICVANWGDGTGVTADELAAVTSFGALFNNNSSILSLEDMAYFTGVTTITTATFTNNANVTKLVIPVNVASMRFNNIRSCPNLTWIKLLPSSAISMSGNNCLYNTNNCPVYVPDNLLATYQTAEYWSQYSTRFYKMSDF